MAFPFVGWLLVWSYSTNVIGEVNDNLERIKKFPKLFDTHIYLARVADPKKTEGVIVSFALMGISMDNALKLSEKILNNIKRFKG